MTASPVPAYTYEAVARDRLHRWGYDQTLGPADQAAFVAKQAADPNLRADADIVWRYATGGMQ